MKIYTCTVRKTFLLVQKVSNSVTHALSRLQARVGGARQCYPAPGPMAPLPPFGRSPATHSHATVARNGQQSKRKECRTSIRDVLAVALLHRFTVAGRAVRSRVLEVVLSTFLLKGASVYLGLDSLSQ